ncbi:phosphotransferase [Stackebrandtia nassauensis]|uniref:Aminoglycoside phosphotransferase n=1 Tax=Stackebrandtia nassauensis (strain DSM 44728 / CIP 108903 / NRRL B-16338 / NBRC 102104 / LLR-40K-21) TaxID=446470 RepID=D3PVX6_STANL|nr:phosphotransferase [Stackebrandtia nassauensis]ADD45097.1 aminoglycoside phosphotransferase [Stackebrandtia nassauensis DSM 44728]
MRFELGDPVPYDATANRPGYDTLPAEVRADITAHLGSEPVHIAKAGGGFTGGFAGVLTGADESRIFVKAAGPHTPFVTNAYSAEAHISPRLPDGVPAPDLRFASQVGEWVVLGFEAIEGRAARLPLDPHDLDRMLAAWASAAEALTPAPQALVELGLPRFADVVGDTFQNFASIVAGELSAPDLQGFPDHFEELARLEAGFNDVLDVDAVHHGDLRPDNMILADDKVWICDWNNPVIGSPVLDTVAFLVVAHGDGHDAEALLKAHPSASGFDDEEIDVILAAIAGYYLCNGDKPLIENVSRYIRQHQRWNGLATLDWLARRRGW